MSDKIFSLILLLQRTPSLIMKIILDIQNLNPYQIEEIKYNKTFQKLSFKYKNRIYELPVVETLGTYVKVFDNDEIEFINYEANLL